jgi:hypothetical protein
MGLQGLLVNLELTERRAPQAPLARRGRLDRQYFFWAMVKRGQPVRLDRQGRKAPMGRPEAAA